MPNKLPWYPHESDAKDDVVISEAMDRFGHFGYAGWFMILDAIHRHGKGDTVTMTPKRFAQELRTKPKCCRNILGMFQESGKIIWEDCGNVWIVTVPKVNEKWKNLKARSGALGSQSADGRIIEKNKNKNKNKRPTETADKPPEVGPAKPKPERQDQIVMNIFLVEYLGLKIGSDDPAMKRQVAAAYKRYKRAGDRLLEMAGGDTRNAVIGLHAIAKGFNSKGLTWNLDTIAKTFLEWNADPKEFSRRMSR